MTFIKNRTNSLSGKNVNLFTETKQLTAKRKVVTHWFTSCYMFYCVMNYTRTEVETQAILSLYINNASKEKTQGCKM